MEQEIARPFTDDQLNSENVSKKQIIEFLQDKAATTVRIVFQ